MLNARFQEQGAVPSARRKVRGHSTSCCATGTNGRSVLGQAFLAGIDFLIWQGNFGHCASQQTLDSTTTTSPDDPAAIQTRMPQAFRPQHHQLSRSCSNMTGSCLGELISAKRHRPNAIR